MGNSIFKISSDYDALMHIIEENEGVIPEELEEQFSITLEDVEAKFSNYAYIIQKLKGEGKTIDDEIARLEKLKKAKENSAKSLENILLMFLPKFGNKVKAGKGYKYVFDLGEIKIENKYTKPLELEDVLENNIKQLIIATCQNVNLDDIAPGEEFKTIRENLDKYSKLEFKIKVDNIKDLKTIANSLDKRLEGYLVYEGIKININKSAIKDDIKEGVEIPGAKIDENHSKLVIK